MRGNIKWTPIAGENERRWRLVPVYKGKMYPCSSDRQTWRARQRIIKAQCKLATTVAQCVTLLSAP